MFVFTFDGALFRFSVKHPFKAPLNEFAYIIGMITPYAANSLFQFPPRMKARSGCCFTPPGPVLPFSFLKPGEDND